MQRRTTSWQSSYSTLPAFARAELAAAASRGHFLAATRPCPRPNTRARSARPATNARVCGSRRTTGSGTSSSDPPPDEPPPRRRPLEGRYEWRLWAWRRSRDPVWGTATCWLCGRPA